jgi:predicted component of type VI protein secretion system
VKKIVNIVAGLMVAAILVSVLTGCGKTKKKSKPCGPTVKVSAPAKVKVTKK